MRDNKECAHAHVMESQTFNMCGAFAILFIFLFFLVFCVILFQRITKQCVCQWCDRQIAWCFAAWHVVARFMKMVHKWQITGPTKLGVLSCYFFYKFKRDLIKLLCICFSLSLSSNNDYSFYYCLKEMTICEFSPALNRIMFSPFLIVSAAQFMNAQDAFHLAINWM